MHYQVFDKGHWSRSAVRGATPLALPSGVLLAGVMASSLFSASAVAATLRPGLSLGANYVQDYFQDVAGGLSRGAGAPGIVHLSAGANGRLWGGSRDNRLYVDFLGTMGSSISAHAGDLQGLDNVAAHDTFKLFSAWYQHTFTKARIKLRVGVQDYNAWFDVLGAAGVFINSSFGLEPTISQLPVSTFPTTTVGAALRWRSAGGLYAMAGIYDGQPGLPGHPNGTQIAWRPRDGVLSAVEAGVVGRGADPYKAAVGAWYRSTDYIDPAGRRRSSNEGFYAIAQHRLPVPHSRLPVDGFVQLGFANSADNQINRYEGIGVDITGPIPERPSDVLAIGVARAHVSGVYQRHSAGSATAETAIEATYLAVLGRHLSIQPDVQYIIDPGASRRIGNAWVVGARLQLGW